MMPSSQSYIVQQIEIWEKEKAQGHKPAEKVSLFCKAIAAVEQRTLKTLSPVTLEVILDRALLQSKERFSLLSSVTAEGKGLNFDELLQNDKFQNQQDEVIQALRHLLIEILTVIGNITAGILTKALFQALFEVSYDPNSHSESQSVRRIHSGRRNSENS